MVIIVFLTFNIIYDKKSFSVIMKNISNIKLYYIFICLGIISLYFILQGIYMKSILNTLRKKISLKKGIFYSIVEYFFSGITPSSTGGQPAQVYYMTKDGIPARKVYITLMLNTIYFKVIIITLGIVALIFKSNYIFSSRPIYIVFFILGFLTDLFVAIICLLLVFKQKLIKLLLNKLVSIAKHIKIFRKKVENLNVDEITNRYQDEVKFIMSHKRVVFINFIITFIQRLLLFSIAYVIYRALGFNYYNYFELLLIQVVVQISIELAPLSGGVGLSEGMLHNIFTMIFAETFADVGMLLTRAFSFYIPLLVCGIIIVIYNIYLRTKKQL